MKNFKISLGEQKYLIKAERFSFTEDKVHFLIGEGVNSRYVATAVIAPGMVIEEE